MKKILSITTLATLLFSCNSVKNTTTMYVSGYTTPCTGVGPQECLLIHNGDNLDSTQWELFYDNIEGFEYEEGYLQKIKVKKEERSVEETPADASIYTYSLVEVLEKEIDNRTLLEGEWSVVNIEGRPINTRATLPNLSFDILTNKVNGFDGCNSFFGDIQKLNNEEITLGNFGATKKMCPNMQLPMSFQKNIHSTVAYSVTESTLEFLDKDGAVVISFAKVKVDPIIAELNSKWTLIEINGAKINKMVKVPVLNIDTDKKSIGGNDGCNSYGGEISKLTNNQISFSGIFATEMYCDDMTIPDQFNEALLAASAYNIEEGKLMLYNAKGIKLMTLIKD